MDDLFHLVAYLFHHSTEYKDLILLLLGIGGVVTFLHKRFVQPFMQKMEAMSDVITAQMKNNGGGSLVDKVARIPVIERKVDRGTKAIADNHKIAEDHWTKLEAGQQQVVKRLEKVELFVAQPKEDGP